jgi:hypothetical protein
MATLGKYCKAYPITRFQEFTGWKEIANGLAADREFLYVQADYSLTKGAFKDQDVVFDGSREDWKSFCSQVLDFSVPEWIGKQAPAE